MVAGLLWALGAVTVLMLLSREEPAGPADAEMPIPTTVLNLLMAALWPLLGLALLVLLYLRRRDEST